MTWNVLWLPGYRKYVVTKHTDESWNKLSQESRLKWALVEVNCGETNRDECKQHAEKIAAYLNEVDIAKEAVIRCTKI